MSIVRTLHEGGFVHGDIRDANLLIDRASLASDDVTIHLIDFDWAGCVGEAKYPIGMNCETVRRPEGIEGGSLSLSSMTSRWYLTCLQINRFSNVLFFKFCRVWDLSENERLGKVANVKTARHGILRCQSFKNDRPAINSRSQNIVVPLHIPCHVWEHQ